MNAKELSNLMADRTESIVQYLLPRGRRKQAEWKAGSVGGEEGDSLSVRVTGAKRGVWSDFATGAAGDILDLWAAVRNVSMAEAIKEAKQYMGVRDEMPHREKPAFKRPAKPQQQKPSVSGARAWLHGRGLTDETIDAFKLGEQKRGTAAYVTFPFFRDGELINVKYRNIAEKKDMRQEAGAEPCLFGWHLIEPKCRRVVITEGEIDAMTLHQMGYPALSCNQGAGNHQWIENDWEHLERFSDILVAYDDDEAGRKGAVEVMNRLGIERCRLVVFGAKDANQWLLDGAERADFDEAIESAKSLDPDELVDASAFIGAAKSLFYPAHEEQMPMLLLGDVYEDCFEFRGSEVSVWTGINGHGKSLLLNQVLLGLAKQGDKLCVFSGEMTPAAQMKRTIKQATGLDRPTAAYIDAVGDWVRGRYWIFNLVGTAALDRLVEVFRYAAKRYGIRQFVVDSLMTTDVQEDGPGAITAQKKAMQKLVAFAKQHNVHVHLVAHPRKGADEKRAPGKMDVGGSGHLTNAADNVFTVFKAELNEDEVEQQKPDALLELHKQRHGEVQNRKFWLWFNPRNQQYTKHHSRRQITFVPFERETSKEEVAA